MIENNLNLARKWRSKNFDQVVGQSLPIKMLKNSLYLNKIFPVYLFSGQRGCGKTSTARVFASALNCSALTAFQGSPREHVVPCLTCTSCVAMAAGRHPDFFEIDAASHTGVDNIRHIIDSTTLLPLMGAKKVYLIDEAHMLSKAAFNALLKVLEEPPESVVFILATTDPQKIIETVKSRCFQLFFSSLDTALLIKHLMMICDQEKIGYDQQGVELIVKESSGSARDALNILEQVRYARGSVTKEAVLQVLGHMDDQAIHALMKVVASGDIVALLQFLEKNNVQQYDAQVIWQRLIDLARTLVWIHYGVKANEDYVDLVPLLSACPLPFLHTMLQVLYANEQLFLKTSSQYGLLEMILLQLCKKTSGGSGASGAPLCTHADSADAVQVAEEVGEEKDDEDFEDDVDAQKSTQQSLWQQFTYHVDRLDEPMLTSLFKQGIYGGYDQDLSRVTLAYPAGNSFFHDVINDKEAKWLPVLQAVFGKNAQLHFTVSDEQRRDMPPVKAARIVVDKKPTVENTKRFTPSATSFSAGAPRVVGAQRFSSLDVSDKNQWPMANLVLDYFPGRVQEVTQVKI